MYHTSMQARAAAPMLQSTLQPPGTTYAVAGYPTMQSSVPQHAIAYASTGQTSSASGSSYLPTNYENVYGAATFQSSTSMPYGYPTSYQQQPQTPTYATTPQRPGGSNPAMEEALQKAALGALQSKSTPLSGFVRAGGMGNMNSPASTNLYGVKESRFGNQNKTGLGFSKKNNPSAIRHRAGESIFYCDVCHISCASLMTFKEHQEGQKHKKKEKQSQAESEAAAKKASRPGGAGGGSSVSSMQFVCELCNVTCTGADAYQAHIKGKQHSKTARLHLKMGKPIPEPKTIPTKAQGTSSATTSGANMRPSGDGQSAEEVVESNVQPVGLEYVVEELSPAGKLVNFHCQLCNCRFNDTVARDMHTKGRRHRLQYKQKVDPTLVVDMKTLPVRDRRAMQHLNDKMRKQNPMQAFPQGFLGAGGCRPPGPHFPPKPLMAGTPFAGMRREPSVHSVLDQYVLQKHANIVITHEEYKVALDLLVACEAALKQLSAEVDVDENIFQKPAAPSTENVDAAATTGDEAVAVKTEATTDTVETLDVNKRALKGYNRVGLFPKHLLLSGDQTVELVVLLARRPTKSLVSMLAQRLQVHFQDSSSQTFMVTINHETYSDITITQLFDKLSISCLIHFTAMESRQASEEKALTALDVMNVVPLEPCIKALALQRQVKWFSAKVLPNQNCLLVIRLLRDLCARVQTWSPLSEWVIEILVERAVNSFMAPMTPGECLRRVFECLASGILLPGGPGLHDPCEKGSEDAAAYLSAQQREDITASAQHALRLIAFNYVYKVLDMEPFPEPQLPANGGGEATASRKRTHVDTEVADEDDKAEMDETIETKQDEEDQEEGVPEKKLALETEEPTVK